ncbi:hypothetical protein GCM10007199_33950 [Fictibacillus barbaricus]|nr:hypothetical protein GCM10007199_33950 [Fictibacillus barbaricus]
MGQEYMEAVEKLLRKGMITVSMQMRKLNAYWVKLKKEEKFKVSKNKMASKDHFIMLFVPTLYIGLTADQAAD